MAGPNDFIGYSVLKVKLELEVDLEIVGEIVPVSLPVVGCVVDFGLNTIPQCSLSIAAGRSSDGLDVSVVDIFADQLRERNPARVYCTLTETSATIINGVPVDRFLLFEGDVAHFGCRVVFGKTEFTLTIIHWLSRLHTSTGLSRIVAPGNAISVNWTSALLDFASDPGLANASNPSSMTIAVASLGNPIVLATDFWGFKEPSGKPSGLKELLLKIIARDYFNWQDILRSGVAVPCLAVGASNDQARDALTRIEPIDGKYRYGVPLQFRTEIFAASLPNRIGVDIGSQLLTDLAQSSIWERLISAYGPSYLFAIVPMVNTALVVPFVGGLRQGNSLLSHRIIHTYEIESFEHIANIPKPIRGLAMITSRSNQTFAPLNRGPNVPPESTTGALYDTCRDGIILFQSGPPWLMNIVNPQANIRNGTVAAPIKSNQSPQANNLTPVANSLASTQDTNLWTNFARTLYVQEVLRHRQARLSGRLRFDIAPGSSVAIELPQDRFVAAQLGNADPPLLFGTVLRVTVTIDAEGCKAGTAFHLGYLRNSAEDEDDDTSVENHPVWKTPFFGSPLVDV